MKISLFPFHYCLDAESKFWHHQILYLNRILHTMPYPLLIVHNLKSFSIFKSKIIWTVGYVLSKILINVQSVWKSSIKSSECSRWNKNNMKNKVNSKHLIKWNSNFKHWQDEIKMKIYPWNNNWSYKLESWAG